MFRDQFFEMCEYKRVLTRSKPVWDFYTIPDDKDGFSVLVPSSTGHCVEFVMDFSGGKFRLNDMEYRTLEALLRALELVC